MCFVPQRSARFRHPNFQKCFQNGVFCAFWLGNVLCATRACNFSFLIWLHGSEPLALASYFSTLPTRKSLEKQNVSRLSCIFFFYLLSSDSFSFSFLLFSSLFFISPYYILSEVWLENFLWLTRRDKSTARMTSSPKCGCVKRGGGGLIHPMFTVHLHLLSAVGHRMERKMVSRDNFGFVASTMWF